MGKKKCCNEKTNEYKLQFLLSAIEDISSNIRMADTKVSIIMGTVAAILAAISDSNQLVSEAFSRIGKNGVNSFIVELFVFITSIGAIGVFLNGIKTLKCHFCKVDYKSKWFFTTSSEYSFEKYKKDVEEMNDKDIVENISAELYKLNDIYNQKIKNATATVNCFVLFLIGLGGIGIMIIICNI